LQNELEIAQNKYAQAQKEFESAKEKASWLEGELARREAWVTKSEETLNRVKEENLGLKDRFIAKERESQDAFTANVNLNKEIKEFVARLLVLEKEVKEKADQIEAQKHQIESLVNQNKAHLDTVVGFQKKEEHSEWVPKPEFNKLSEEYARLKDELSQLKSRLAQKEIPSPPPPSLGN
jgi:chromosome segregation ATPase